MEVLIIGAGPAGSVAAALLRQQGRQVWCSSASSFPRFSIGESLLPQSMEYLEQGGMLRAVVEAGFQLKNGAAFRAATGNTPNSISARNTHRAGALPIRCRERALIICWRLEAEAQGAEVRYRHEVVAVDVSGDRPRVTVKDPEGEDYLVEASFILDASGFGRDSTAPAATRDAIEFSRARRHIHAYRRPASRSQGLTAIRFG